MPIRPPDPGPEESESEYLSRAHVALTSDIPDAASRHSAVTNAWRMSHGEGELERKAYQKFPHDKFLHIRDVPVFMEHEVVGIDGKLRKYDREALQAITDRCNARIADTGDFAALSDGHTPTELQRASGVKSPDVLGYSGPFRIGMVGNEKPRWAIFADEHHFKDRALELERKSRRSAEVWLEPNIHNQFMDPIAALGADTPRLDMGTRYARTSSGYMVEKYASEMNAGTATLDVKSSKPGRFEMLSPEDVKQIVDAVLETAPMQWVQAQMEATMAPEPTPGANASVPAETSPEPPPAVSSSVSAPPSENDEDKKKPYQNLDEKMRYQKLQDAHVALLARVGVIEADKVKAEHYGKLSELRTMRAFDIDKECTRCINMIPEVFADHCASILENYQPIPIGMSLFVPPLEMPRPAGQTERYTKAQIDNAVHAATEMANKGQVADFASLLAQQAKVG